MRMSMLWGLGLSYPHRAHFANDLSLQPNRGESALRFRIFHERVPDEVAALVFRHEHADAGVDSEHIGVIPPSQRVECVEEAIALPGLRILRAKIAENSDAIRGQERK